MSKDCTCGGCKALYGTIERDVRSVTIEWNDEPGVYYNTLVCIDGQWTDGEDDDNIFFYFANEDEMLDAMNGNVEDFRIVEVL